MIRLGAATGGILAARSGPKAMAISAAFGGIILAVMEGVGAMIGKMGSDSYKPVAPVLDLPTPPPLPAPTTSPSSPAPSVPSNNQESSTSSLDAAVAEVKPKSQRSMFGLF
jgi:mitochondrial import inner membrane translocase subunit TIM17